MTGHQINSLVGDLVAMAQAMERLPIAEQELSEARQEIMAKVDMINAIAADLEQSRAFVVTLQTKVHDLEVARDDAELRFLEADDKIAAFTRLVSAFNVDATGLVQAMTPEPAKPLPMGEALGGSNEGQSEPDPISNNTTAPTVTSDDGHPASPNVSSVESVSASLAGPASADTPLTLMVGRFTGLNYIDVPGFVSREDWLAGGGTNESYDFRYARPLS